MKRPHIGNLKKRAKALGLVITKATTAQDAYDFGYHSYVLHKPEDDWESMPMYSLWGIMVAIEQEEQDK